MNREAWILTGFAVLFLAAVVVSTCGWVLLWRARRLPDEPAGPEEEIAPFLPPGNPLR